MKTLNIIIALAFSVSGVSAQALPPQSFLHFTTDEMQRKKALISQPGVDGIEVVYQWSKLEPQEGVFDFTSIERDLDFLKGLSKKLFIQIQQYVHAPADRQLPSFLTDQPEADNRSDYENVTPENKNSTTSVRWNEKTRIKYQNLLNAIAMAYDDHIYGVSLPKVVIIAPSQNVASLTCDHYLNATMDNIRPVKRAFKNSHVIQYVNFCPCKRGANEEVTLFDFAAQHHVGTGGAGVFLGAGGRIKLYYSYLHDYRGKLPIVSLTVQAIRTHATNNLHKDFLQYAGDYLGANIIFLDINAPQKEGTLEKLIF